MCFKARVVANGNIYIYDVGLPLVTLHQPHQYMFFQDTTPEVIYA